VNGGARLASVPAAFIETELVPLTASRKDPEHIIH
jgi:hypothetical protein